MKPANLSGFFEIVSASTNSKGRRLKIKSDVSIDTVELMVPSAFKIPLVEVGMHVYVDSAEFDSLNNSYRLVEEPKDPLSSFIVVNPFVQLSASKIRDTYSCLRKVAMQEIFAKEQMSTMAQMKGTMVHKAIEQAVLGEIPAEEPIKGEDTELEKKTIKAIEQLKSSPTIDEWTLIEIKETESNLSSFKLGLKCIFDFVGQFKHISSGETCMFPIEVKSGIHRKEDEIQLLCYILASKEILQQRHFEGFLLNINHDGMEKLAYTRKDLLNLIELRNRAAAEITRIKADFTRINEISPIPENPPCETCLHKDNCMTLNRNFEKTKSKLSLEYELDPTSKEVFLTELESINKKANISLSAYRKSFFASKFNSRNKTMKCNIKGKITGIPKSMIVSSKFEDIKTDKVRVLVGVTFYNAFVIRRTKFTLYLVFFNEFPEKVGNYVLVRPYAPKLQENRIMRSNLVDLVRKENIFFGKYTNERNDVDFSKTISTFVSGSGCDFTEEAKTAIESALQYNVSSVQGGPGTGKKILIMALLMIFKSFKNRVLLLCEDFKEVRDFCESVDWRYEKVNWTQHEEFDREAKFVVCEGKQLDKRRFDVNFDFCIVFRSELIGDNHVQSAFLCSSKMVFVGSKPDFGKVTVLNRNYTHDTQMIEYLKSLQIPVSGKGQSFKFEFTGLDLLSSIMQSNYAAHFVHCKGEQDRGGRFNSREAKVIHDFLKEFDEKKCLEKVGVLSASMEMVNTIKTDLELKTGTVFDRVCLFSEGFRMRCPVVLVSLVKCNSKFDWGDELKYLKMALSSAFHKIIFVGDQLALEDLTKAFGSATIYQKSWNLN